MTTHSKDDRAARLRQAVRLKRVAARPRISELAPRPIDQPAHLGAMQHSLWLLHRMDPNSPAYNLTSAFYVSGSLDLSRLERGFNEVVSRHRILRSTFREQGGSVLQVVHPPSRCGVEVLEVADEALQAAAVREARSPFDLTKGPLIRLLMLRKSAGQQGLLLLVLHHILADERSLVFLWEELAAAYDGRDFDRQSGIQYDDYLHWLAQRDPGDRVDQLDFWRRRLNPLPDNLTLPFENPACAARATRGRFLRHTAEQDLYLAIRRLAADTATTPFIIYAFAFRLLLHRYTDGQRIAFATPVSLRSHPATAKMIGYFLNAVVIPTDMDETQSVERAIRDFSQAMRAFLAHAAVPFDTLAEELAAPRQPDRHPVFQTMFVFQEEGPPPKLGAERLEPVALDLGESKFDLTLFVSESEHALEIAIEYRCDRFDEVWMHNMFGHYETLLGQLTDHLARPTAEVPMLRPQEEAMLRTNALGAPREAAEAALLPRQILAQADRSPKTSALSCGGAHWSYSELVEAGRYLARELVVRGVKPGDRVGLFLERSPWMIAGLLGCHLAGAAYVPLDPTYPAARNRDLLEDADVAAVLTSSLAFSSLPAGSWTTITVDELDGGAGTEPVTLPTIDPEAMAYLLYTSGSSGRPKGVMVSHDNLRASTAARFQVYDVPPKRFLLLPSVAFDSSVAGIFWTLAGTGTLVIPTDQEARDARRLASLVVEERITHLLCVPSLYAHLIEADSDKLQGLDVVIVAGESCASQLAEAHFRAVPRARLFNEYGPTEATVWASVHEVSRQDADRPVAIGRPIPGVRLEVYDALGRRVAAGIPGQAWIIGPTVARGYWRRQDLTDRSFISVADDRGDIGTAERGYRSGDRMAWTADGRLRFLGREDEQIKLRGFRIEPGEIEAALRELPEIAEAAVVARPVGAGDTAGSSLGDSQLVAFAETRHGDATVKPREALAKRLPEFMLPSRIVALSKLPRLPNGKIDRRRLREMALDAESPVDEVQRVPNTREQGLISLWEGLLERSGIGLSDNFFQLGGHSLLVLAMTSAIERDFGVQLLAADVFQNPTVQELARRIEQQGGPAVPAYRHLFPIQPGGRGIPFIFGVPHFFSAMIARRFRGERPVYGLRGVSLRAEGNRGQWRTMRDLANELVEEIQMRFPDQICIMAGYSFGSSMAIEAVRLMEERGIPVHRLYLIAPMPVDYYRIGPFRVQLDGLRKPVDELSFAEVLRLIARTYHPFTRRPYRRIRYLLTTRSWRRLLCWIGSIRVAFGLPLTPRILHADVRVERFRLHARYRPGIIHTPTVVFNAREPATNAAATWRPYFGGPFTVHETPDPHLDEPSIAAAKDLILRHLSDMGDA